MHHTYQRFPCSSCSDDNMPSNIRVLVSLLFDRLLSNYSTVLKQRIIFSISAKRHILDQLTPILTSVALSTQYCEFLLAQMIILCGRSTKRYCQVHECRRFPNSHSSETAPAKIGCTIKRHKNLQNRSPAQVLAGRHGRRGADDTDGCFNKNGR